MIPGDDEAPRGTPDWMVTYGDLMSLLLTLFVMIVSMSEIKQNDRFQGVADSLHNQFGFRGTPSNGLAGELQPRNAALAVLAVTGRERRMAAMELAQATGPAERSIATPAARRTATGRTIFFEQASSELSAAARNELQQLAESLAGKPQRIEVRGVGVEASPSGNPATPDAWDLGWRQSLAVVQSLVETHGIEPERIRVATPISGTTGTPVGAKEGPRVEVFLLDEVGIRAPAPSSLPIRSAARTNP